MKKAILMVFMFTGTIFAQIIPGAGAGSVNAGSVSGSGGGGTYTAGAGLSLAANEFSVAAAQTTITSLTVPGNANLLLDVTPAAFGTGELRAGKISGGGAYIRIYDNSGNLRLTDQMSQGFIFGYGTTSIVPIGDGDTNWGHPNQRWKNISLSGTINVGARVASAFNKTDTSLADVTGLSVALEASTAYHFVAELFIDASAGGGQKVAINVSSAPTSIIYQVISTDNSSGLNSLTSRQTTNGGAAAIAGGTNYFTRITGTVVANGAGNLTVQFAQSTASGTSTVVAGSKLEVFRF